MRVIIVAALVGVAIVVGFGAGMLVIASLDLVLPPHRLEDGDTAAEFLSVGTAYLTWAVTSVSVVILGLGRLRSRG